MSNSELEAFKDRLNSILLEKLNSLKAETGQGDSNRPVEVYYDSRQTLQQVEKLEKSDRNAEQLAMRLSRDLKIGASSDQSTERSINESDIDSPQQDSSHGRLSIVNLRQNNAGMVAEKVKLFSAMSASAKSDDKHVNIRRTFVNKKRGEVLTLTKDLRRPFKASTQSPFVRTIRRCANNQKDELLNPEIVNEVTSPKLYCSPYGRATCNNEQARLNSNSTKKRPSRSQRIPVSSVVHLTCIL